MVKAGMAPKQLQYLAGHSSIQITLDHYTHLSVEDAEKEVRRIEACCTE
jgi:integrase